ncbi:MAG TPA: hypothetical protein VGJ05_04475 [Fimbriiglobus sp.]|jgi:hypothetical protein
MSDSSPTPDPLVERLTRLERQLATLADRPAPLLLTPAGDEPPGLFHPPAVSRALIPVAPQVDQNPWSWAGVGQTLRLIVRMYFDPRYRLSRLAQIGVPAIVLIVILNYSFWNYLVAVPFLSQVMERLALAVLAVVLYKLLAKEAVRYKAVLDYLGRYG